MDLARISQEIIRAQRQFALVELHPTGDGGVYAKTALQTSAGRTYVAAVHFNNYPNEVPQVYITAPTLMNGTPHRYNKGNLCLLHPSMWNPGKHDLIFVVGRIAKWLNKYEVWREKGYWPGAQIKH